MRQEVSSIAERVHIAACESKALEPEPCSCGSATRRSVRFNRSANTDPQLKVAASPPMLVVRLPLR